MRRPFVRLAFGVPFLLVLDLLQPPARAEALVPRTAIVTSAVENVYVRPDATAEVDDQVILGETVEPLEETQGFTKVRCQSGTVGWVDERTLVRDAKARYGTPYEVAYSFANLYRADDFSSSRPLLTAPLAARLDVIRTFEQGGHAWAEVRLPVGRRAFAACAVLFPVSEIRPAIPDPAKWIEMAKRFVGAPYT